MPKFKPNKGLVKRVRVTKNGKVVSKSCGSSHRKVVKTPAQRRRLNRTRPLSATTAKQVKKQLGM